MSDYRQALDHIMHLCESSRQFTRRTQTIHNIAMRALGLTAGQRIERHNKALEFQKTYWEKIEKQRINK